jgi:hypothetical protein
MPAESESSGLIILIRNIIAGTKKATATGESAATRLSLLPPFFLSMVPLNRYTAASAPAKKLIMTHLIWENAGSVWQLISLLNMMA